MQNPKLTLLTASTASIIGTVTVGNYLKDPSSVDSDLIEALCNVAINWVERYTGLITSQQTWMQKQPGGIEEIELFKGPITSILEVKAYDDFDSSGSLLTESIDFRLVDRTLYSNNGYWDEMRKGDGYQIKYEVGLESGDPRIEVLTIAALRLVSFLYENREEYVQQVGDAFNVVYNFSDISPAITTLLNPISEEVGF